MMEKRTLKGKKILVSLLLLFCMVSGYAQLTVSTGSTMQQLVQTLTGCGVETPTNITYTGAAESIGYFTTGTIPTNLGISEGVVISTGKVNYTSLISNYQPCVNQSAPLGSPANGVFPYVNNSAMYLPGDADLAAMVGLDPNSYFSTADAAIIEFDVVPKSNILQLRYVFASEEYPGYVGSNCNDMFAFFVTGPNPSGPAYNKKNIALIPGTNTPVAINTVNGGVLGTSYGAYQQASNYNLSNTAYFVDNSNGQTIVYNGFTKVFTATCNVVSGQTYHIKIAIADGSNVCYDSAIFLEAFSFQSPEVTVSNTYSNPVVDNFAAIEGCSKGMVTIKLASPTPVDSTFSFTISGSALNGTDYTAVANSITIPAGQDSAIIIIDPILDNITEGEDTVILTIPVTTCNAVEYYTDTLYIKDNTKLLAQASPDTLICGGEQVLLSATATGGITPYSYDWGVSTTSSVTVNPVTTTSYTVTVTDMCGSSATDDVVVTIKNSTLEAGGNDTICAGESITLQASGGASYLWSNGINGPTNSITITQEGSYTYYVVDALNCNAKDSVTIVVNANPVADFSMPQSACLGIPTDIVYTGSTGSTQEYDWSLDGGTILNLAADGSCQTTWTTAGVKSVSLQVRNGACLSNIVTNQIQVKVSPVANFSGTNLSGCPPLDAVFEDLSLNVDASTTYLWDFGDGSISTLSNPTHSYTSSGFYDVSLTVSNGTGCDQTYTMSNMVHVFSLPTAQFNVSSTDVSIFDPAISFFDASVCSTPMTSWEWSLGDGNVQNGKENFSYTYQDTGKYEVTLTVTSADGCLDTDTKMIQVKEDQTLYIPNAFTPNGDMNNDEFHVYAFGETLNGYSISIFNRWGVLVFTSDDIEAIWTGEKNEAGVYCYMITYMDAIQKKKSLYGYITLYR